ncbi:MAG: serine/threonine-protein kinase [Myxococcales bacterium]
MDDSRRAPLSVPRPPVQGPDPLIGRIVNDRYRIVGIIARGGMGKVYRAEQQPLGRLVALKVLDPNYTGDNDPEFHRRFFLEASIASKLSHPNTVTIFDYGKTDDDIYYIAMELLEGRTLHRALRDEGPFAPDRVVHIGRQICRSLREAHALGVIHRDLKPANVYLVQHGDENDLVKVLDFGLVKNVEDKAGEELTQTGLFMGSPKYMSPEQIRGDAVDARVDVYALGVMMYEMLTGKVPFDRANSVNILMAHIQEEVPLMSEHNANVRIPPALEQVVRKCMAKQREDRYASMDAVLTALKQCGYMGGTISGEHRLDSGDNSIVFGALHSPISSTVRVANDATLSGPVLSTAFDSPAVEPAPVVANKPKRSWLPLAAGAALLVSVGAGMAFSRGSEPTKEQPGVAPAATAAPVAERPSSVGEAPVAAAPSNVAPAAAEPQVAPSVGTVLVSLRSTPPGAMVVVGGKEFGPTPTQLEWSGADAAVGREVTFRFQRKGYRDLTVTRQIRGDRLEVEAPPMDPIPVRRPTRDERPAGAAPGAKGPGVVAPLKDYKAEPY